MLKGMFALGRIGRLRLKNRIIMAPMGDYLHEFGQSISQQQVAYFAERARGGAGLVTQTVYASNKFEHSLTRFDNEEKIFRISYLTQAVHNCGAKMGVMLSLGHGRLMPEAITGRDPKSPSPTPLWSDPSRTSVAYTNKEVYELVDDFRRAAGIAYRGGYDTILIQGYGGYLIDQFMTPLWNSRSDEFGGSLDNRMRFPLLLIDAIRDACGKDYPVIFKMTPDHLIPGGRTIEEGLEIARRLEAAGVAALQIDVGCIDKWYEQIEPVYHQERVKQFAYAGKIKEVVRIPVFTQGKVGDPVEAEAVFNEGLTDFVVLGRSFLADPEWPLKVRENRLEDIRPCICCNEGCIGRIDASRTISCAVNPRCGCESVLEVRPAGRRRKVIVVGGGPGGCEAALVAAERGHEVELWEAKSALGGMANAAAGPVNKKEIRRLVEFYKAQVGKNRNIALRLGTTATAESILAAAPDAVIVATGGSPIVPAIPGIGGANVIPAYDALLDKRRLGKKIVVAGGGFVGCEVAMHLAQSGKDVLLVEMRERILPEPDRNPLNTFMMLEDIIANSGIAVRTGCKLTAIGDAGVTLQRDDGAAENIGCDAVVIALGYRPDYALEDALAGTVEVTTIGDAAGARKILNAVWEGFGAAMSI